MNSLSMEDFVRLLLIRLAVNSQIIDLNNKNIKYACIPADYKQRIAYILTEDNGWKDEFSRIIDVDEYSKNHFEWEANMSKCLVNELAYMGRKYEYDFEFDRIKILYTQDFINVIMNTFKDEELINVMDHFVFLLNSEIFSRQYLESYSDKYIASLRNMCEIFGIKNVNDETRLLLIQKKYK